MKGNWLTGFLHSLILCTIIAQPCLPEGVIFRSQEQVDAFLSIYEDCRELSGPVIIEEELPGNITNLQGLHRLTEIGNYLEIRNNHALKDLKGLEDLVRIGGRLTISGNQALTSVEALKSLNFVGESLRISDNPSLSNISSLTHLQVIRGDLSISDNRSLVHFQGFRNLLEIDGSLLVSGNQILSDMDGLQNLRIIRGNFLIHDNVFLRDVTGLESLLQIGGDFIVDYNPSLTGFAGLGNLTSVGGYFHLVNNRSLVDLQEFRSLKTIFGLLQIYNNDALESLSGLDSINHLAIGSLAIISCPNLTDCAVTSICNFLKDEQSIHSISKNRSGCNDPGEIIENCNRIGINSNPGLNRILFFPNPTPGILRFTGYIENAVLSVKDVAGKLLFQQPQEGDVIDLSKMPTGAYLIELKSERMSVVSPVIKM
jgi:hypothetical protein